jgi:hypothetical protein
LSSKHKIDPRVRITFCGYVTARTPPFVFGDLERM